MAQRYYSSTSVAATLSSSVDATSPTVQVSATTGFPTSTPYTLVLDNGAPSEEVVTVTKAVGTTLTVTRAVEGGTGTPHASGASVVHGVSAVDFNDIYGSKVSLDRLFVDVRDYGGAPGSSAATNTTALAAAIAKANTLKVPVFLAGGAWAINSDVITIPQRLMIWGAGRDVTTITVSGTGTAFRTATPGTRAFDWNLSGFSVTTSTAAVGFDCDSLSTSVFRDIKVAGFSDVGFYLHSTDPGGSVYNRWYNCSVQSTPTGYRLRANSSNANVWHACRAANCSAFGWDIADSNDNTITASQAELCGTAVSITAAAAGYASWNRIHDVRMESCTIGVTIGANVNNTMADGIWSDSSTPTLFNDNGTNTRRVSQYLSARTVNSIVQLDAGWSFISGASITLGTASSSIRSASTAPLYLLGLASDVAGAVGVWLGNGNTLTPGIDRRIVGFSRDTPVVHGSPASYITSNGSYEFAGSGVKVMSGAGSPEASVTAPIGSLYLRSDGGAGTTMYVKESGTGNTGWVGK